MRTKWADDIEEGLRKRGGDVCWVHLDQIYAEVWKIPQRRLVESFKDTIRGTLERHSRASDRFNGIERVSK